MERVNDGTRDGAEESTEIRAEVAGSGETVPRKNPPVCPAGSRPPLGKGVNRPLPAPACADRQADLSPQPLFGKGGSAETTAAYPNFYAINRMASDSGKPKIEDIKYKSKLIGPVDEIASLRVKDFRQLSDSPVKAAEMIKNKIDILEDDSFAKKIGGIKAWRSSEIFKAYLEMGQRAIAEGKKIGEMADKPPHQKFWCGGKHGLETDGHGSRMARLTEEEFYAIMDLNKRLRF